MAHDLYLRLGEDDDPSLLLTSDAVDVLTPIAAFPAGSEIAAIMRQAATPVPGGWVADDSDPEQPFAALVAAAADGEGSGWLGWEPYDGADATCVEPVIRLTNYATA